MHFLERTIGNCLRAARIPRPHGFMPKRLSAPLGVIGMLNFSYAARPTHLLGCLRRQTSVCAISSYTLKPGLTEGFCVRLFDDKERKWDTYLAGEELFGLPQIEYPELRQPGSACRV